MTLSGGDRIEVRGLKAFGHHGALAGEQDKAQPFVVDLDVHLDLRRPQATDFLDDAVDYGHVALRTVEIITTTRFALLEALAGSIADELLADRRIDRVAVRLHKLCAPLDVEMASIGVRICRERE